MESNRILWLPSMLGIITLSFAGCLHRGPAVASAVDGQRESLPPETRRWIEECNRASVPWQPAAGDTVAARRQLFEMRARLIQAGQIVRGSFPDGRAGNNELSLELQVSETVICGEHVEIKLTLSNSTDHQLRLCVWDRNFRLEILHSSGRAPREPPMAAARAGEHAPIPSAEDFVTLDPGAKTIKVIEVRWLPENLPGGTYQIGAFFNDWVASQIVQTQFVIGNDVRGLSADLKPMKDAFGPDDPVSFVGSLRKAAKAGPINVRMLAGSVIFRDVSTGKEMEIPAVSHDVVASSPTGWPIYPTRQSYRQFEIDKEMNFRLSISQEQRKFQPYHDFLQPGRRYQVKWRYANDADWFLENGRVFQLYAWLGQIVTSSVEITLLE